MKNLIVSILLSAGLALSQAPTVSPSPTAPSAAMTAPVPAPVTVYPSYMVSMGGGYTRNNGTPNIAEGWVSGAYGLGSGNYIITTVDMFANSSSVRAGYAKIFASSGNFMMGARVDAGASTVTPVIGSFTGGGFILYDLNGISKKMAGLKFVVELRITGATSVGSSTTQSTNAAGQVITTTSNSVVNAGLVTPGIYFGFAKTF